MTDLSYDPNAMEFGRIAGNTSINALIYHCFDHICEADKRKFVRKFRELPDDSDQIMHTFRELVLGGYLSSRGFRVRHDYAIGGKTPDWSILDDGGSVVGLVELTNLHIDWVTESEIEKQLQARGMATIWPDKGKGVDHNLWRLYYCIQRKASMYTSLVEKLEVPYVVGVFPEFTAAVEFEEEVRRCLFDVNTGLFGLYREISGVLYFEDAPRGRYLFKYAHNPDALRVLDLPSGVFPSGTAQ